MDESSLRNYFRRVLGVSAGASRKELKLCRDKRAQKWRAVLVAPTLDERPTPKDGSEAANTAEGRLAITNTAYDCLSNSEKFREYQSRLAAGEAFLPDIDSLLATLGESNVKPIAARVLAKRHQQLQDKMDRIVVLAIESVKKAGHDQALKLTQGKLPNADLFYDSVYKAAQEAGNQTCVQEITELEKAKLEVDETFQSELFSVVVDQAEMIAHKEYDRLEDKAASSAPTPAMPRVVALVLSLVIMGLVVSVCFYGVTSQPYAPPGGIPPAASVPAPDASVNANAGAASTMPATNTLVTGNTLAGANSMPAAPQTGIANSVFNKSVFGPDNSQVAGQGATNQVNSGSAPVVLPAPVLHPITDTEVLEAELPPVVNATPPPPSDSFTTALVGNAGAAGLAGYATGGTKAGATLYSAGIDSAMKGAYGESLRNFTEAYAAGKSREALYNQGVVLALQMQFQPAVEVYTQLLAINPTFPQALYNRGLTHQYLSSQAWQVKNIAEWRKQLTLAVKNYSLAVKADPRMSQAFYNRGLAYDHLGQLEKSSADFTKASSLPVFSQAAAYNRDVINAALKKNQAMPASPAPPAPVGPVGPPGPA